MRTPAHRPPLLVLTDTYVRLTLCPAAARAAQDAGLSLCEVVDRLLALGMPGAVGDAAEFETIADYVRSIPVHRWAP